MFEILLLRMVLFGEDGKVFGYLWNFWSLFKNYKLLWLEVDGIMIMLKYYYKCMNIL